MEVVRTPAAIREWRRARGGTLGFVPTMGYLHEGHLSLVRRARAGNDGVAASIFVNPTQFGPGEDFARYPRDEERDLALLRAEGVAAVYMPDPATMYCPGFQTWIDVTEVSQPLEGAARPAHFRGVATVVLKLFNAVEPTRAYFGRKDGQQLRVIRRMAADLDLGVEIVPCDTVREPDGLAMSSRNAYLTPEEREEAPAIYAALQDARSRFAAGLRDATAVRKLVRRHLTLIPGAEVAYISLADDETLAELHGQVAGPALLSVAVQLGKARLIDNVELQ